MIKRYDPLTVELAESERPGNPPARSAVLYTADGQKHGVWEAEPGVHSGYQGQETVVILQGRATVTGESGQTVEVGQGDVFICQPGEKMTWTVHEKVRKVFVINS